MLIIADSRMPESAKRQLEILGEVEWIVPQICTYPAIAAHPDIFFCKTDDVFIAAPNAPENIIKILMNYDIPLIIGKNSIGSRHPETAFYNAVFTKEYFIHNTKLSDEKLLAHVKDRTIIHVSQGYTRCNLIPISDKSFLTSDRNIEKSLLKYHTDVLFVEPNNILLPNVNHGFIGGCCGVFGKTIVFIGSLAKHPQGYEIKTFLNDNNLNIIELYDGKLWDGGSIIFCQKTL